MGTYKVLFKNNVAVSAKLVKSNPQNGIVELDMQNGKQVILWFIAEADNKKEAMDIATKVIQGIWGAVLGIS